jgi:hypothetical protein
MYQNYISTHNAESNDDLVGKGVGYGLDSQIFPFITMSRTTLESTPASYSMYIKVSFPGYKAARL